MEENSVNPKKPLRTMTNKSKDLFDAYIKNEGGKTYQVPATDDRKESLDEHLIEPKDSTEKETENELEILNQNLSQELNELKERTQILENEKKELQEQVLRRTAELENFRRRTQKEKEELIKFANEQLLQKFIQLLDDLANAVESSQNNSDYQALEKGIDLIYQKAKKLFEQEGVTEIENPVGKPFDYNFHEALMTIPSDLPEGYVVKELQKGYKLFNKVIRHTKVITSLGTTDNNGSEN